MKTDRHIIMELCKKSKNGEIVWKPTLNNKNITIWKSIEKITEKKSLIYTIFHKKNKPNETNLVIYFDKGSSVENNIMRNNTNNIKSINSSNYITILLRYILEKKGYIIFKKVVSVIRDKRNADNILIIKKFDDEKWSLPYDIVSKVDDNLISEILDNQLNIYATNKESIKYRDIYKKNDVYHNLIPYSITNYYGFVEHGDNIEKFMWIKLDDIYNLDIDDETKRFLNFLIINDN